MECCQKSPLSNTFRQMCRRPLGSTESAILSTSLWCYYTKGLKVEVLYCSLKWVLSSYFNWIVINLCWIWQQLYRKKTGESMSSARLSDNLSKNRYRDISPCETTTHLKLSIVFISMNFSSDDSTRVVLNDCLTGDYINASFVNMEIPASGLINRYFSYVSQLLFKTFLSFRQIYRNSGPSQRDNWRLLANGLGAEVSSYYYGHSSRRKGTKKVPQVLARRGRRTCDLRTL